MKLSFVKVLGIVLCLGLMTGCGEKQEVIQNPILGDEDEKTGTETTQSEQTAAEENQGQLVEEKEEPEIENDDSQQVISKSRVNENIHIVDSVIYDKEGVTVTVGDVSHYDSYTDNYICTVKVVNNNPDNKKVSFDTCAITLNGIEAKTGGMSLGQISAGESRETDVTIYVENYKKALNELGEDLNTFPIETIGYYYAVQTGSDGEREEGHIILKTSNYQEGNLDKAYGDKVYEFNVEDVTFETYLRKNKDGICAVIKNSGDVDMSFSGNLNFINEDGAYDHPVWVVNGKAANYYKFSDLSFKSTIRSGGGIETFPIDTPENIRKDLEIPNDEPLEVSIQLSFGSYDDEAVIIPISLE